MTATERVLDAAALTRLRARLVADRDRAASNGRHAHTEQVQLVNDGIKAGLDAALRLLDAALDETGEQSSGKPRAGAPARSAGRQ